MLLLKRLTRNKSVRQNFAPGGDYGFTRAGLMAVVLVVTILSGVFMPALRRMKEKSAQAVCMRNLSQLGNAIFLYIDSNDDTFPGPGSRATYGFHVEDWIYWRTNSKSYPPVSQSPIVKYITSFNPNRLRCPIDLDNSERQFTTDAYIYSYALTSLEVSGGESGGMASIFDATRAYLFTLSRVKNPGHKIMFGEEQASHKSTESIDVGGSSSIINDGRWIPPFDLISLRHQKEGNVTFADGHVARIKPQAARTVDYYDPKR
jgi:prepilin-type processing-associated H-X9-DG protein